MLSFNSDPSLKAADREEAINEALYDAICDGDGRPSADALAHHLAKHGLVIVDSASHDKMLTTFQVVVSVLEGAREFPPGVWRALRDIVTKIGECCTQSDWATFVLEPINGTKDRKLRRSEMVTLYWIRKDGQGSFNMGTFATEAQAMNAIPDAKAELLGQCGEDYQKAEIEAGRWEVEGVVPNEDENDGD